MSNEPTPYTEAARREIAHAAAAKLQRYLDEITAAAEDIEQTTGVRIVHQRPHILAARRSELEALRRQAEAWLLAAAVIDRWMLPNDQRTLGDVAKTMPRNELNELRHALRLAGALSDGGDIR